MTTPDRLDSWRRTAALDSRAGQPVGDALLDACNALEQVQGAYDQAHGHAKLLLVALSEAEADRDRARDAAVALEQENARLTERVTELEHTYLAYDTDDKGPVGMAEFLTDEERGL